MKASQKQYIREMREVAREIGNCPRCFQERDNPKYKICSRCRLYQRQWNRRNR